MSSRPPERGMSLMEVLVAAGLALLLGTMILGVIVPSMRISQREWARMELEQAAALAKEKIMVDLMQSSSAGLSLLTPTHDVSIDPNTGIPTPGDKAALAICRLVDVTNGRTQVW